jgi:hypothetical protein
LSPAVATLTTVNRDVAFSLRPSPSGERVGRPGAPRCDIVRTLRRAGAVARRAGPYGVTSCAVTRRQGRSASEWHWRPARRHDVGSPT